MFVKIDSAERLGKALGSAGNSVGGKGDANPMLSCLLLEAMGEQLVITATDEGNHQLRLVVPAKVNIPGKVIVPPGYIAKVVSNLGAGEVTLRHENNQLQISSNIDDTHTFNLFQGDPDDFPVDVEYPEIVGAIDANGLAEALKAIMGAAMTPEQEITFVGDNNTIVIYTSEFVTVRSKFQMLDMPAPFIFGVRKLALAGNRLPPWSGRINIHVGYDEENKVNKVMFSQGDEHLMIRSVLSETDISAFDDLLDMPPLGQMVVSAQVLKNRVKTVAYDKQVICRLKVVGKVSGQQKLMVAAETSGFVNSNMVVTIQGHIAGTAADVILDALLFSKALQAVDGDDFRLDLIDYNGDQSEIFLRVSNDANPEKRQALIVPLQA